MHDNNFEMIVSKASQLPLVKINRRDFLFETFDKFCDAETMNKMLEYGPIQVGISDDKILKAAKAVGVKHYFIEDESPSHAAQIPVTIAYIKSLTK